MKNKFDGLAASLASSGTCTDYCFLMSFGFLYELLCPFVWVCWLVYCALEVFCRFVGQNRYRLVADTVFGNRYRLNTFTFKSDELRILYRFVGQNRYRLVPAIVFENRSTDCVFSNGKRPTSYFSLCRSKSHIYAPDSVLSFLIQNRCFVGHVGQKQITLSGGSFNGSV